MNGSFKQTANAPSEPAMRHWAWRDKPVVRRLLRMSMGLLLAKEAALALWTTGLVWEVTRDPELFPRVSRYPVSIVGAAAGTCLAVHCAVLALLLLSSLGGVTPLQQRLGQSALRVHIAVAVVASGVWLWGGWPALGPEDFLLGPPVLIAASWLWGKLVVGTLAWGQSGP